MKKVRFDDNVEIKYYRKDLKKTSNKNSGNDTIISNKDRHKYLIYLILFCLLGFFIVYLSI